MISKNNTISKQSKLNIRNAVSADIEHICSLIGRVYTNMPSYPKDVIRGQINSFPEGHFVAEYAGQIVGYCATIRLPEEKVLAAHNWREITGNGFGTTHDPDGDYLYGYEVCVDPEFRRLRIGDRLYKARKQLCQYLRLKGIVFAGRMPQLAKTLAKVGSIDVYLEKVRQKKIRDSVLLFQLRNQFELIGVLKDYLPSDKDSLGYAAHLRWLNPEYQELTPNSSKKNTQRESTDIVRLATVQYMQRRISSFADFADIVTYFVDVVADYHSDFVCFPELFSMQLLSIHNEPVRPEEAVAKLSDHKEDLDHLFHNLAIKFNVNIIAGSHPYRVRDGIYNTSNIYLRDGSTYFQPKIHPTPNERYWWNVKGGNKLQAIDTDCGKIGVLICYDAEFPELARHLVDQGANIIFVPYLTDERQSYCRVRYSAAARAVENQIYVVMSGSVGNLPRVPNMDIHYAQSCILTPCDFPFPRDGIAADTSPNVETVAFADVRMDSLRNARQYGTVRNLKDRRHDLYNVVWHEKN